MSKYAQNYPSSSLILLLTHGTDRLRTIPEAATSASAQAESHCLFTYGQQLFLDGNSTALLPIACFPIPSGCCEF